MTDDAAATLLDEVARVRRRTRRDRHAYWPPMLLLGVLILAAPLVYGRAVPASAKLQVLFTVSPPTWRIPGTTLYFAPLELFGSGRALTNDPTTVAVYWLCVVLLGVAATMVWYRWRGSRVGIETSMRTFVLVGIAGLLFLLGILPVISSAIMYPYFGYYSAFGVWLSAAVFVVTAVPSAFALRGHERRPIWRDALGWAGMAIALLSASSLLFYASIQGYAPLLVLGTALLVLAMIERSALCGAIAVLFAIAALVTNLYDMENVYFRLSSRSTDDPRLIAFAHLVVPAAVLIVGGVVAGVVARMGKR